MGYLFPVVSAKELLALECLITVMRQQQATDGERGVLVVYLVPVRHDCVWRNRLGGTLVEPHKNGNEGRSGRQARIDGTIEHERVGQASGERICHRKVGERYR